MRIFLVSAIVLPLAGCVLPPAMVAASYVGDAILVATTDKTSTDHLLSMAEKRDCAMWRVVKGQPVCHDWKDGKNPYEKYRDPDGNQVATAGSDAGFTADMAKDSRQEVEDQMAARSDGIAPRPGVLLAQAGNDRPVVSAADARRAAGMVRSAPLGPLPAMPGPSSGASTPPATSVATSDATVNDGIPVTQPVPPAALAPSTAVSGTAPSVAPTAAPAPANGSASVKPAGKPVVPVKAAGRHGADRYVVLGSFRLPDNARRVQRAHGDIRPVVQQVTVNKKRFYRVVAGPYTASRAADIRDSLKQTSHLEPIVARDCDATAGRRHCIEIDG